jgi:prepilin-type N-terminal cleavage/methylation domain-containing protein
MAEDLMPQKTYCDGRCLGRRRKAQTGFSMIEMLMTAFILAIGILGLSMLQVMSLKASRGSRSLTTAVQVGEKVMDQIEMEGRVSWLNITDSNAVAAAITPVVTLKYVNLATSDPSTPGAGFKETFNIKGQDPQPASTDPADKNPYFTVRTYRLPTVVGGGVTGNMDDFTVQVDFVDIVNTSTNAQIHRTVTLTRRILHG